MVQRWAETRHILCQLVQSEVITGIQELFQLCFQTCETGGPFELQRCEDEKFGHSLLQQQLLVMGRKSLKRGDAQCPRNCVVSDVTLLVCLLQSDKIQVSPVLSRRRGHDVSTRSNGDKRGKGVEAEKGENKWLD